MTDIVQTLIMQCLLLSVCSVRSIRLGRWKSLRTTDRAVVVLTGANAVFLVGLIVT